MTFYILLRLASKLLISLVNLGKPFTEGTEGHGGGGGGGGGGKSYWGWDGGRADSCDKTKKKYIPKVKRRVKIRINTKK